MRGVDENQPRYVSGLLGCLDHCDEPTIRMADQDRRAWRADDPEQLVQLSGMITALGDGFGFALRPIPVRSYVHAYALARRRLAIGSQLVWSSPTAASNTRVGPGPPLHQM
jgi:hypothetical protein